MNNHHKLKHLSLRYRLIFLFFFIVVVPFSFIGYFAYNQSVKTIESTNSWFSLDLLDQIGVNLSQFLELVNSTQNEIMLDSRFQALMDTSPKSDLDEVNFTMELKTFLSTKPDEFRIRAYPIRPKDFPFFTTYEYGTPEKLVSEPWFIRARNERVPFWELFLPDDHPTLFTEPTLSKVKVLTSLNEQHPKGIVLIDVTQNRLRQYLDPLQRVKEQQIMLLDEDGTVLYHPDRERIGQPVPPGGISDFIRTDKSGSKSTEVDGRKTLVTFTTLESTGWKLVSTLPVSGLTAPVSRIGEYTVLFLVFYFLLSILTIVYITVKFTNPIENLVLKMKKAERGNFSLEPGQVGRQDEVGWLYRGYDNLVRQVQVLIGDAQKAERDKQTLEFQVLTHQINPHFLYNTLESIRWKAESHGARDVSEMVSSLGSLLRLSLNQGKELTTVRRELEHVQAYAVIQKARLDQPIRIVYMVDEEIMELPMLRLLLQPLVENAIQHGFMQRPVQGKIVIKGRREPDALIFEVIDNGIGIPDEKKRQLLNGIHVSDPHHKGGVGMRSVHERLRLYFGEPFGLLIRDSEPRGTVIELRHPVLDSDNIRMLDRTS